MSRGSGSFGRRKFLAGSAGLLAAGSAPGAQGGYADGSFAGGEITGPFRPYWESLKAYRYPDWFRDAKFGIWAHWSPQCVPEQGDWYAHGMYVQGSGQYNYHVKTYGHPSKFGYKDVCHIWRGGKLESGRTDPALRQDRGQVLRRAGQPPWKLRLLGFEVSALELRERRAEEGHRGHVATGRARARAQIWDHLSWHARTSLAGVYAGPVRQR